MKAIKNEKVLFVDVDDTLVMWKKFGTDEAVLIPDAYSKEELKGYPNRNNIRLLKEKKRRGYTVIVWSQGGYKHAESVVLALKLKSFVDFVMTKPTCYVDDIPVCSWFPARVYLGPESRYKNVG